MDASLTFTFHWAQSYLVSAVPCMWHKSFAPPLILLELPVIWSTPHPTASLTMPKPLTVWIPTNCGKFLKTGIPDHLTCFLRNLHAGQEATVRIGYGTMDWIQIGKGVCQGCLLSPCLFNFYAGYIMQNARLDEAKAGIKISGRNINNLR